MKPLSISLVGLLLILLSTSYIKAQGSQIGLDIGYGLTKISDEFTLILPGDDDLLDFAMIGISYSFTLTNISLSLKSGMNYNIRGFNNTRLTYLRIPLGAESKLGKKVQFIIGGGLFLGYLLISDGTEIDHRFDEYKNNLQFGFYGNIGIGFQLSPKYNLCLTYQADTDLTKIFEYEMQEHVGYNYYTVFKKGHDSFVKLSLYYRFSTK